MASERLEAEPMRAHVTPSDSQYVDVTPELVARLLRESGANVPAGKPVAMLNLPDRGAIRLYFRAQ